MTDLKLWMHKWYKWYLVFAGVRHCVYVEERDWSCWKELKLSSIMLNHFLWNSKERIILCNPLNAKIHMSFSVFSDETYGEIEKKNLPEKGFWCSILFQHCLTSLQPLTTFISTRGFLVGWARVNFLCQLPPASRNLYENFKWFAEVGLYIIKKWGCTRGCMPLDIRIL